MDKQKIEETITQMIDQMLATIPMQLQDVKLHSEVLKVEHEQEYIFGMIMGMAISVGGSLLSDQENPTPEDQAEILEIIYSKVPDIRARIFQ